MTCDRKQTEKRLNYCRSRDMIRGRCASIFARQNYLNNRSYGLCTFLLTYVVCCNFVISN